MLIKIHDTKKCIKENAAVVRSRLRLGLLSLTYGGTSEEVWKYIVSVCVFFHSFINIEGFPTQQKCNIFISTT